MKLAKILTSCALFAVPGVAVAVSISGVDREANHLHPFKEQIEFTGYTYGSYNYLVRSNKFISGVYNRAYDIATNGFRLNQVYGQAELTPEYGIGGFANVLIGSDAITTDPQGINPDVFQLRNFGLATPEAYLKFDYGKTQLHAGLILTLSGYESFVYTEDNNYSRSILDNYAQPGKHMGFRLIHWIANQWKLVFGTLNAWSSVEDAGRQTGMEAGIEYHNGDIFLLNANFFSTNSYLSDDVSNGPFGRRSLVDIFGHYNLTDNLQLAWNFDYGWQTKAELPTGAIDEAVWKGIAGYVNYQINDKWRTSFRAEVYDDGEGYTTGVRQVWKELTLTVGYELITDLELQAETRHDFSSTAAFANKGGEGANNNQQSFAVAGVYKFE